MSRNALDLTGQQFGRWTVLARHIERKPGIYWICQCECGVVRSVNGGALNSGKSQSCGCLHSEVVKTLHEKDELGKRYGRLTVIARDDILSEQRSYTWWKCRCDCGNTVSIRSSDLRTRANQKTPLSCGCARGDQTGKQYGQLTVEKYNRDTTECTCRCECGNSIVVKTGVLRRGRTACYTCQPKRQSIKRQQTRYGHLTILKDTGKRYFSWVVYLCRCDCGNLCEASHKLSRYDDIACEECKPDYGIQVVSDK